MLADYELLFASPSLILITKKITKLDEDKSAMIGRRRQQDSPWRPVSVNLGGGNSDATSQSEDFNHYDNPKLQKRATRDLPVQPGEGVAMFFGLEVLDPSKFEIMRDGDQKKLKIYQSNPEEDKSGVPGAKITFAADEKEVIPIRKTKEKELTVHDAQSTSMKKKRRNPNSDLECKSENLTVEEAKAAASSSDEKTRMAAKAARRMTKKLKKEKSGRFDAAGELSKVDNPIGSDKLVSKFGIDVDGIKSEVSDQALSSHGSTSVAALSNSANDLDEQPSPDQISEIQLNWSSASGGIVLNERLCRSLVTLGYSRPTPIQASTLSAAILGRRNVVGASPTGSGKTLAFLLPILQHMAEQDQSDGAETAIQALILTPTRELAQQIHAECERLLPKQCVCLVGGVALVKQTRLLQSKPRVIVATPGRLWAMVRLLCSRSQRKFYSMP